MTLLNFVCILMVVHFVWYVITIRKKEGFIIDFWAFTLVMSNMVYYFLLYPFAKSLENEISTGDAQAKIASSVDYAAFIVIIGYFFMWVGKYWHSYVNRKQKYTPPKLWRLAKVVTRIIKSRNALWVLFIIFSPFFIFVAKESLASVNLFDVRSTVGGSGSERPLYNIATSVYPIFMGVLGILYISLKKNKYLIGLLLLTAFSFIFGSRSIALNGLVTVLFVYISMNAKKIGLTKVLLMVLVLFAVVIGFGILRSGSDSVNSEQILSSILYGNNFSDLRDFAWFLSSWNGELLWGKTYISGLLSFIPSGLWEFRAIWGIGKVTTTVTGLTGEFHGGLRITMFGESFLNFGYFGLIIFATTFGYLLEAINVKVMKFIRMGFNIEAYAMILMASILTSLMMTAGFFMFYIVFVPMIILDLISTKKKKITEIN